MSAVEALARSSSRTRTYGLCVEEIVVTLRVFAITVSYGQNAAHAGCDMILDVGQAPNLRMCEIRRPNPQPESAVQTTQSARSRADGPLVRVGPRRGGDVVSVRSGCHGSRRFLRGLSPSPWASLRFLDPPSEPCMRFSRTRLAPRQSTTDIPPCHWRWSMTRAVLNSSQTFTCGLIAGWAIPRSVPDRSTHLATGPSLRRVMLSTPIIATNMACSDFRSPLPPFHFRL